ncbi:MAG: methyltransferase [Nautiliaceae bacterium]
MRFNRFAFSYSKYNDIQKAIIKRYVFNLKNRVVDLGCGSEGLCKYRNFDFYLGVDKSEEMLKRNPCNTFLCDFDERKCFERLREFEFEEIVSFSALQWSRDLKKVFENIALFKKSFTLALFTSNTFKNLHQFLGVKSPIYSKEEILEYSKVLSPKVEILKFKKEFKTSIEMLRYIKFSGVNPKKMADINKLRKICKKNLIKELEFEVIVLKS